MVSPPANEGESPPLRGGSPVTPVESPRQRRSSRSGTPSGRTPRRRDRLERRSSAVAGCGRISVRSSRPKQRSGARSRASSMATNDLSRGRKKRQSPKASTRRAPSLSLYDSFTGTLGDFTSMFNETPGRDRAKSRKRSTNYMKCQRKDCQLRIRRNSSQFNYTSDRWSSVPRSKRDLPPLKSADKKCDKCGKWYHKTMCYLDHKPCRSRRRRRMPPRNHGRDSPVMVRLLKEIWEANEAYERAKKQ